jgi:2-polyprenyl-3-methyl-5-hydroxy-6-metoxy-1,4-benzoquinol methylase
VLEFEYAHDAPLGNSLCFRWCDCCDFIFAQHLDAEAYRSFYHSKLNDTGHVSDTDTTANLHRLQAALILSYLGGDFRGNCLDFGAGEGQLLELLSALLPDATIRGTDLRNSLRPGGAAHFIRSNRAGAAPARFDLIIMSHVAEHLVDLSEIATVMAYLAPGGSLYIEVPDPLGYNDCPRREFMYYFDRLHVNHFSRSSLTRWLAQHSFVVTRFGTHQFA